jgi:hypothetical protein
MEHNQYLQEHLRQDASGLSQQDQLAMLRKLNEAAHQHMKQWISQRGSR